MLFTLIALRVILLVGIFVGLIYAGRARHIRQRSGWVLFTIGFGAVAIGSCLELGTHIPALHHLELFRDVETNTIFSEFFGHLLGIGLLTIGLFQWGPPLYQAYISEAERVETERKFQGIVNTSQEGIAILRDGKVVFANPSLEKMLGYSSEELRLHNFTFFLDDEDKTRAQQRSKSIVVEQSIGNRAEYRLKPKHGGTRHALVSAQHIQWKKADCVLVSVSDVTDWKQSEAGFSAIIETAVEAIAIIQDENIVFCNQAMVDVFGHPMEALINKPFFEYVHPDDREMIYTRYLARQAGESVEVKYDYRILDKDGNVVWVMISAGLMEWKGEQATLAILSNVTERREAENEALLARKDLERKVRERTRELQLLNEKLVVLNEQKSAFVSSASHELRSPLTSILGFAVLVKKVLKKHILPLVSNDAELKGRVESSLGNLEIINSEGDRLTRLINDMLDLNKIESGKMDWRDEQLALQSVVDIVAAGARVKIAAKPEVDLKVDVQKDSFMVMADQDRIIQVMANLVDNAIKFTEEGRVSIDVRKIDGDRVEMRVDDSGIGLSDKDRCLIFERYYQAQSSAERMTVPPKGTGLGLAICREIVEHYEGSIGVEPGPGGKGSSFYVRLPLM